MGFFDRLLGTTPAPTKPPTAAPKEAGRKALTPLDAPMIQARFKTMGVFEQMDAIDVEHLKRAILHHCQERRDEIWWWPVSDVPRGGRHHLPLEVLPSHYKSLDQLAERITALERLLVGRNFQILSVRPADGDARAGALPEGPHVVRCRVKDRERSLTFDVRGGLIDVPDLVRTLNGLLMACQMGDRFLLLPPQGDAWGVVQCPVLVAERAAAAHWGSLEYPRA